MRRWVLGLGSIAAGIWFWQTRVEGATGDSEPGAAMESLAHVSSAGTDVAPPPARSSAQGTAESEAPERSEVDGLRAALERSEPAALAAGYRRLLDLSGPARAAVAAALERSAGEDLATQLVALGEGNAFLHSDAGRAAGRRAVAAAVGTRGEEGLRALTGIVERAMRGTIEPADVEARAFIDEVRAAMQAPLNRTVFNPEYTAGARTHKVVRGESLDRIAATYRKQGIVLDSLTIALFNRIDDPTKLRVDQVLKIPVQPVFTVIEKQSFLMALYLGEVIFRVYWVGHGKDDRTPETTFTVGLKQERPDWHIEGRVIPYGHPDNILGDYFVKFVHASFQGYGAHGTPAPETIGMMASRGCIRMQDNDIRDFFQVVPRGSQVHVRATRGPGSR